MKRAKLKIWGALVAGSVLVGGFAQAESPYAATTPLNYVVMADMPTATAVNTCVAERALRDTLYWAVQVYDQCIATENANCTVPNFEGYALPGRARLVQLRNQAKADAEACLNGE